MPDQIEFWVWEAGGRWSYRSASVPSSYGTDSQVTGLNCRSRAAAMAQARMELKEYGYGARLVPVPENFMLDNKQHAV